jgi:Ca-activated chloride channel family protein
MVAAQAANSGVSVTAIGVGLDYDESVLGSMAARSGGRFYHLREPSQMAVILESELNALSQTVARNVIIDVVPAPGVQFVSATGADIVDQGQQVRLRVGEIQGGGHRPVIVSLRLPAEGDEVRDAAQVNLSYSSHSGEARNASTTVRYGVTTSQTAVDESLRPQFALAVEQHRTAMATLNAAEALNSGDADRAADLLEQQAVAMEQRAQAMPRAQRAAMHRRASKVRSHSQRARRARSRPAQRAGSLDLHDDALDGLGL